MAGCALASIPLIAALAGVGSCTTFDGLSPAPPAATQLGNAYLPLKDAARVCALAFSCPNSFNGDLVCMLANLACTSGREIRWDAKAEKLVGNDDLAMMLERTARAPWKVEPA